MNVEHVLPRDAIPSIDAPQFGTDYFGDPDDEVLVVDGDPPRAYPLRILSSHEIINDWLDDRPIAVTWCPICWSGVVYDRRVGDRTLSFGVSGKLADDALAMYDRETESEWKQTSGECFAGELAGTTLDALPSPITTWGRFRSEHQDGVVLQPVREDEGPPSEVYNMDRYRAYVDADAFGLYGMRGTGEPREWDRSDLAPKDLVLGVERGGIARGYPLTRVESAGGAVRDTVGGLDVVVFAHEDGLDAFEDPGYAFERTGERFRADGTTWEGATGASDDGRHLQRVPARRLFAFAWQDDHGPDAFWSVPLDESA